VAVAVESRNTCQNWCILITPYKPAVAVAAAAAAACKVRYEGRSW
jgi:hypothetical protein